LQLPYKLQPPAVFLYVTICVICCFTFNFIVLGQKTDRKKEGRVGGREGGGLGRGMRRRAGREMGRKGQVGV